MNSEDIARLRLQLAKHPAGEFHFPEIYGPDWDDLYIGDKVKLGHAFLDAVRKGDFPGIKDTGEKKDGGHVYLKLG